jgi:23S rRNA (guanosine2251-2'-O)-methyltransferase
MNKLPRGIYGFHAIEEALRKSSGAGLVKYHTSAARGSKRVSAILRLAGEKGLTLKEVSQDELDRDSSGGDHRGVIFFPKAGSSGERKVAMSFDHWIEHFASEEGEQLLLILDGITDPQNLGAILRSADQFGVDLVILPERRSAKESPVVHKISSGASSWVQTVTVVNLVRAIEQLKEEGFWIYGADMEGEPVWGSKLGGKTVIVMGSEGKGLSALVKKSCDGLLSIPTTGHVDSLNVSVASGIFLYEYRRQTSV